MKPLSSGPVVSEHDEQETCLRKSISLGLAKMLLMHESRQACWYHIHNEPKSDRNLSTYLGLDESDYDQVLMACSLSTRRSGVANPTYYNSKDKWKAFCISQDLPPEQYHMMIQRDSKRSNFKRLLWIRLGICKSNQDNYSPLTQPEDVKIWSCESIEQKFVQRNESECSTVSKWKFVVTALRQWGKEADDNETDNFEGGTEGGETESLGFGGAQEEENGHDVDKAKFPTLAKTNLVVTSQSLSSLLRDIVNFTRVFPDDFKVRKGKGGK